jgi:hypothetical protein
VSSSTRIIIENLQIVSAPSFIIIVVRIITVIVPTTGSRRARCVLTLSDTPRQAVVVILLTSAVGVRLGGFRSRQCRRSASCVNIACVKDVIFVVLLDAATAAVGRRPGSVYRLMSKSFDADIVDAPQPIDGDCGGGAIGTVQPPTSVDRCRLLMRRGPLCAGEGRRGTRLLCWPDAAGRLSADGWRTC